MAPTFCSAFQPVRLVVFATLAFIALGPTSRPAAAQANPTPNTFSTLAGSYTGTYSAGGVCGGASSGSKFISVDTLGDGCPLQQAVLGPSLSGIGMDGAGNIYVDDYTNGAVRKIDAKSGIVTKVIGTGNTVCSATTSATGTKQDSLGSGCVNTSALGPATARGMNVDPWGNVIIGSYNSNMINIVCLATSPLCPGTANRKQVGSFYRIAGCIASQGSGATGETGISAYTGGDNSLASPFQNLSGDVAAWGLTGAAATAATVGTAGTCSSTSGAVNSARNAQADKYGNVYIADTSGDRYRLVLGPASYNGVTNPLFAIINMNPKYAANEGYIYTILGSFSSFTMNTITYNVPTAAGQACSSASTTIQSTDAYGDGCAFFETGKPAGATSPAGIGVDKDGNPIFSDNTDGLVRVLYVGGTTMANIIITNNPGVTPVVGTVYAIEGTGTASKGATPELNVSNGSISSGNTKVAVDGSDNIYLSDGTGINIIDATTGYLRRPISTGGTACLSGVNGNGDGCATGQGTSWTSLSSVGTAIAVDNLGNLLLADSTGRVRKVLAGTLYPTAVGSSFAQNIVFHEPAGTTSITATLLNAAAGISLSGSPTCTLYATSSDNTADCTVVVTFAPTVPGKVGATLAITNSGGGGATTLYPLTGMAADAALVTDTASPKQSTVATFGTNGLPTSLAFDTGGNLYVIDNHALIVNRISGGVTTTVGTITRAANQVAVDIAGNVYVTAVGASSITKFTLTSAGSYTSSTITTATIATPQGIVFDVQGNMYVSDATTQSVYEIPNDSGFANQQGAIALVTGLASPTLLSFDGLGNLLIADTGVVYSFNASTSTLTTVASASSGGVVLSGLTAVGIAGDAGGNVYIQDRASKNVYELPYQTFAPGTVTVLSGQTTPSGLAVDGMGQIYVADSGLANPAILKILRASETYTFPTSTTTYSGVFTNTGNANSTGYAQTDSAEFPYTGTGSGGCGTISGTSVLLIGGACNFSVTPNLGNNGQLVTNTTALLPATSIGSLSLTAQEATGITYATTTTVTGPASAVYLASGTEATFKVAESASNSTSQNGELVKVSIDSGATVNYTLASGSVNVPVSGLTAGGHTIVATYPGDGTYLSSTSSTFNFTITQASTTVSWTPGATTQQYSAAIGTSVLNATATSSGQNAPGAFIYTATPTGGSATYVHSASYLPIGTYALGVTFVPTDSVDYAQSTASVASYTVTKASTTAAVAASQMLVAADGSGNYTNVQAAVNALPSGGSIYIKPGTYTGDITVVQPNVALRGLGGDPTKVILTHAGGAFGGSGVYAYAGEFTVAMENGYQLPAGSSQFTGDEGSATLVIAKGVNTALSSSTTIPNGFYGENFTLVNTYDSDNVTTTTTYLPSSNSGTCTANEGPAQTYNYLFNNSLLCASQALAIWTTSDLSVMNNVYTTSLQDTIYAASQGSGSSGYVPARQYWFRGKVTGTVDYIFGDAAAVFDNTSVYTVWHGTTATGTETIHAQNKAVQTGTSGDYLSGYIMNSDVFTSQSTGMTQLFFGRPYGTYSTWIMLNSYVDQVNPTGYTTGLGPTLTPTTFSEYNDITYTDPATNAADLNGIPYLGTGGNTGTGVSGPREISSTNPGTPMASDNPPTAMTQAQAQAYFPTNFLSQTVPSAVSSTQNWNPTTALAANVNAFVPSGTSATVASGTSVTILMRPQTPGLGAVSNANYTIPTGTYTLKDTYNGTTTTLTSGSLDASGEAYFTSSTLNAGTHSLSWSYSGDTNFSGSTTASAYTLTVSGTATTTTLSGTTPITYGQTENLTATVSAASGTPAGTVVLTIDSTITQTTTLSGGRATFSVSGLLPGVHTFTANYGGSPTFVNSTSTTYSITVNTATPIVTVSPAAISYGTASATLSASIAYTGPAAPTGKVTFAVDSGTAVTAACTGSSSPLSCTASYTTSTLTGGSHTITATVAADTNYSIGTGTATLTVNQIVPTVTASPVAIVYGAAATTLTASIAYTGPAAPTGAVTITVDSGTAATATCTGSSSPLSCTASYTTSSLTTGNHTITASLAVSTNYTAASGTATLTVNQATPTITFTVPGHTYGNAPFTVSAISNSTGAFTYSVVSGPASISGSTVTLTGAGSVTLLASEAADTNYIASSQQATFLVAQAAPSVSVSAVSSVLGTASATLTSTISYNGALTPTGAVTFTVNSTNFTGTCTAATGVRTCTATDNATAGLATGGYTIAVSEAADTNYAAVSGTGTLTVVSAPDFSFSISGTTYQSVIPGNTATFNFTLAPLYATYPGGVTFSASGLPPGATYTFTPSTVSATGTQQAVVLTIQTPRPLAKSVIAGNHSPWLPSTGFAIAFLVLPLCLPRKLRSSLTAQLSILLLFIGSLGAFALLTGCGGGGNGFLEQAPANYSIVITATSGSVQHTATVTLNVQ